MKKAKNSVRIRLKTAHELQAWVYSDTPRIVVKAGRRGGKTTGSALKAVDHFLKGGRVLYGAPTQEQVDAFWHEVKYALEPAINAGTYYKNESTHVIELLGTKLRIRA